MNDGNFLRAQIYEKKKKELKMKKNILNKNTKAMIKIIKILKQILKMS